MGKKMASIFLPNHFFAQKTAYFWSAARTVRSPGFLGLALQRAVDRKHSKPRNKKRRSRGVNHKNGVKVLPVGLEPTTYGLRVSCSTN
jgi:hypothetical protein